MSIVTPPLKMKHPELQEYLADKGNVNKLLVLVYTNKLETKFYYRYLTIKDGEWEWELVKGYEDNPYDPMYYKFINYPESKEEQESLERYIAHRFKGSFFTIKNINSI